MGDIKEEEKVEKLTSVSQEETNEKEIIQEKNNTNQAKTDSNKKEKTKKDAENTQKESVKSGIPNEETKKTDKLVKQNQKPSKDKKNKKIAVISLIVGFLIIVATLLSTVFALTNIDNEKILNNISIAGIDVSNLSKQEAKEKINKYIENRLTNEINIDNGNGLKKVTFDELSVVYNVDKAIDEAYNQGRNSNIIGNNYAIINSYFNKKDISLDFIVDEEKVNYIAKDLQNELPNAVTNFSYEIDGKNLIVTPGKKGLKIKEDELKKSIINKINNYNSDIIKVTTEEVEPEKVSAQELREKIYVEPKDAYYEYKPKFVIYPHVVGVDFAITVEEVQKILDAPKDEYVIPLKLTNPKILTGNIGSENFPDLLGSFSTNYNASDTARSQNLKLASNKINGTVVLPGETFSYNNVVGKRTVEAGYKDAKIYENGKVVDGLGGGICQVSSTLYNAVLKANLQIVERRNHMFKTSYIEAGRDATVVYGSIDFKFKNTREYPIKIKCSSQNGVCKFEIYGIREDNEYEVSISVKNLGSTPFETKYEDTTSLPEGTTKVIQNGMNGFKTETYLTLKQNGQVKSTTKISTDTYKPMTKIIQRGVQVETPTWSTSVEPTPSVETPVVTEPATQTPAQQEVTIPQTSETTSSSATTETPTQTQIEETTPTI